MNLLDLNGNWRMKKVTGGNWLDVTVPGSVFNDLLLNGKIEDPFYRDNEDQAIEIASEDYQYQRTFQVSQNFLKQDRIILCCEGLDTLSEIRLNGTEVAKTHNMHRKYEFDVKDYLIEGQNTINITFFSPLEYISEKQKEYPTWGTTDAVEGFQHLRKAHSMFGWDWGPKIPDSGIWRDIYIAGYNTALLSDVYIIQKHTDNNVALDIKVEHSLVTGECKYCTEKSLTIEVTVTSPYNEVIKSSLLSRKTENNISVVIDHPQLWWPNGYGSQPLYSVQVVLKDEACVLDQKQYTIGLREIKVKRENDQWGESFEFNINGVSIFAMGADYIPEDNLLPRCNPERTENLLKDCIAANFNCIRVWGGGHYPWDYFYDLCDKYGLLVWQDLMFACAIYNLTDDFAQNIEKEAIDNIKRIRHHACLGIICGNNEMETAWCDWGLPTTPKLQTDYIKQFEVLLSDASKASAPDILYWPSSPSSGGSFDNPNDFNRGDVHYWEVWHGQKPFTEYRKYFFRFASEFGFQSFPSPKTIDQFTLPEDRNIFSEVMEKHQKNGAANGKILYYLADNFKYPKDFDSLVYTSQVLQAEAIKYGVEHWRRNRGRCMGAIYWQLNDCWPVASWSSIDYYGRWKALHYYAKRFFASVLLSACDEGPKIRLNISNETMSAFSGTIKWRLVKNIDGVIKEDSFDVNVPSLSAEYFDELDFSANLMSKEDKRNTYFEYSLIKDGRNLSEGTILFVKPKHFNFIKPQLITEVLDSGDKYIINISADELAKYVWLDLKDNDCIFSDNCLDLTKGSARQLSVMKSSLSKQVTPQEFEASLIVKSIVDIV